jgi:1,4-dihydroxy-6-naphthoate synthase
MNIRCAISPDPDDLFMFWGIMEGHVDREGFNWDISTNDTDTLNRMALGNGPDVSAISIAHYPQVAKDYRLFRHGASVGRGYGPVLVCPVGSPLLPMGRRGALAPPATPPPLHAAGLAAALAGRRVAVPGLTTTAYLVLRWLLPGFEPVVTPIIPYRRTFDAMRDGSVQAALLIHEGRLTFGDEGCEQLLDIGMAWTERTGLPLPLGGNVVRRTLGESAIQRVDRAIANSIAFALAHREQAMDWLIARGVSLSTRERLDQYLAMYANEDTRDMGDDGCAGVARLLEIGAENGWMDRVNIDFV